MNYIMYEKKTDNDIELWERYFKTKDIEIRNEIVEKYSYIVKIIAMKIRGVYQQFADVDDIVNEGIIALMDSISRFDLSKNIKFETFATIRIKGAIIDYVRKQAWTPRRVNKNKKMVEDAQRELSVDLGRNPTDAEISSFLKIDIQDYNKIIMETSNSNLLSFEDLVSQVSNNSTFLENTPESHFEKEELLGVLAEAIDSLNDKEKTIISLYYKEEIKMKNIADIMSISNSRASQIHSQALGKLSDKLKKYLEDK